MRDNEVSEVLLHFIWEFRYFNQRELTTEAGEPVFIHSPGGHNTDQGPDFSNARITIGDTRREGPVELHVKTSDWHRHGHMGDPRYAEVILHVVWDNDTIAPPDGIPILVLQDRIPKLLLPRYQQFMTSRSFVPCERLLTGAREVLGADVREGVASGVREARESGWPAFRDRLLNERLAQRMAFIRTLMDEHNPHWEEITFQLIARSLGQPVNTDAFLAIARSVPLHTFLRRRTDPAYLESLFLARAPLLSFHRMRPAHSPHVRLRQLAALLAQHNGWFTLLLESDDPAALLTTLDAGGIGAATRRSILINAHIPLLYTYGTLRQEYQQRDKALRWLHVLPSEDNSIIRRWVQLGMPARNAADTQALLELKKKYCVEKRCLECTIGQTLLRAPSPASETPL